MSKIPLITRLRRFKKHHSYAYIAWRLGYKTSATIENWINRNSIPSYMEERIIELLDEIERNGEPCITPKPIQPEAAV